MTLTDEQLAAVADIRAINGLPAAYELAYRIGWEAATKRAAELCRELKRGVAVEFLGGDTSLLGCMMTTPSESQKATAETCARAIEGE